MRKLKLDYCIQITVVGSLCWSCTAAFYLFYNRRRAWSCIPT